MGVVTANNLFQRSAKSRAADLDVTTTRTNLSFLT